MNLVTNTGFIIKNVIWYTDMEAHCIGIVSGETAEGVEKSYIGVGYGLDEDSDALHIAQTGAKFYPIIHQPCTSKTSTSGELTPR